MAILRMGQAGFCLSKSNDISGRAARGLLLCAAAPLVLALTPAALAQTAAPPPADSVAAAQPLAAANEPGDVIVTARQRSETLATTPLSVSAISPTQLENTNALTIQDVSGSIPNLVIQQVGAGASAAAIAIRGVVFADIEKSFDPAVGVLVDGVFIGTNTGQLLDFFDIGSLEVLRGPQGTLFGRNTIGGVINIRRTRPTGEFGGKGEVTFGNYGLFQAKGVLNVPIIKDVLAVKLFEQHTHSDGYYYNVTFKRSEPGITSDNFGAAFLFTPAPNFEALLTVEKQTQRGHTVNSSGSTTGDLVCLVAPANQCNRNLTTDLYTTFTEFDNPTRYSSPAATLEMNWNVSDDVKLTSITGWRKSNESFYQDFDGTSAQLYETIRDQFYRQFSQELRVSAKVSETFDFVSGLYYFDNRYTNHQTTFLGPILGGTTANQFAEQNSKSYAAYLDANWAFADHFRVTVGGRYTKDSKTFRNRFPGAFDVSASKDWSKFTPKISVDYRPNEQVMFYASYSRGYRAGGFNGRATSVATSQQSYDPETVDSYEGGIKTQFFDRKLSFNIAAFKTKYDNKQESIIRRTPPGSPNASETVVANVASASIKGIEADFTARPVRGLSLNGSVGFLKSNYNDFLTLNPLTLTPIDFSGLSLTFNPSFTGSVGGSYTAPTAIGDITLSTNYRHISTYFTAITPDPSNPNPAAPTLNVVASRTRPLDQWDMSVALEPDLGTGNFKPRINLYMRNILDKRGIAANTIVPGLFKSPNAREPRTYGIELGFSF
ncbi:TonB-dependent receptor [Sphingomonas sp. TX0543]|uniref:TonB-dependent receptor n=1 Tax=unclassified Sphingomonas TaxID=196159 RepID=UPI0010F65ACE|nr:TonB-dependent receptor [Sphingomonas sp. 3P27F8]